MTYKSLIGKIAKSSVRSSLALIPNVTSVVEFSAVKYHILQQMIKGAEFQKFDKQIYFDQGFY